MEGNLDQSSDGGMRNAAASAFGIVSSSQATEDLPPMRAVTIIMSQPATLQVTAPASFGKAPAAGVARPIPLSASHGRSFSAGVSVRKEWNESNWNICSPLCQVPLGFPLERTHREIYGDAAEVANRISNALRNMSVETEYDGENAKAKCTSLDQVNFRIRLFAGGEDGLPVIVEVQRRCGSSSSFMKICRQILNGAEGGAVAKSRSKPCTRMPPFIKGAIGNMSCLQSVVKKEEGKPELDALNKSIELLKCQKKCSNLLGLENLCFLTDPLKTRPDKALSSCKDIVLGERRAELREKVVAILLQKDAFLPEQYSAELLAKQSRHMALVLLSNSLLLTSKDGCLADAVESQKWFSDTLIPTLLDEVKSFKMSSNNAYEAACSLASLANCSDVAKKIMKENAALEYLRAAHHYGKENHELLSSETELTLIALGAPI